MKDVSVVIPIYKDTLDLYEKKSLLQCINLLGHHGVSLVHPASFDLNLFYATNNITKFQFNSFPFADKYFQGIDGYNKLLLSQHFYESFSDFRFILIYQLDAWVFKDELLFWLSQDYDYIGAPWIGNNVRDYLCNRVGNGGFSLRKIKTFLTIMNSPKFRYCPYHNLSELINFYVEYYRKNCEVNQAKKTQALLKSWVRSLGYMNNLNHIKLNFYEDVFWSMCVPKIFPKFRIPTVNIAKRFSIETNSQGSYIATSFDLPFGCHGWEKHNKNLWQPHIDKSFCNNPSSN